MRAVEAIGVEADAPGENKRREPGVGKDKKTGKAGYTSGLQMFFFLPSSLNPSQRI